MYILYYMCKECNIHYIICVLQLYMSIQRETHLLMPPQLLKFQLH